MSTFTAERRFTFPLPFDKGTISHPDIEVVKGDDVVIVFKAHDVYGDSLDMTGATLVYNVAQEGSEGLLFAVSATVSTNTITVQIDPDNFTDTGDYFGQLRATKSGKDVVISTGNIKILPKIA